MPAPAPPPPGRGAGSMPSTRMPRAAPASAGSRHCSPTPPPARRAPAGSAPAPPRRLPSHCRRRSGCRRRNRGNPAREQRSGATVWPSCARPQPLAHQHLERLGRVRRRGAPREAVGGAASAPCRRHSSGSSRRSNGRPRSADRQRTSVMRPSPPRRRSFGRRRAAAAPAVVRRRPTSAMQCPRCAGAVARPSNSCGSRADRRHASPAARCRPAESSAGRPRASTGRACRS